jgi:hypothetical protein
MQSILFQVQNRMALSLFEAICHYIRVGGHIYCMKNKWFGVRMYKLCDCKSDGSGDSGSSKGFPKTGQCI